LKKQKDQVGAKDIFRFIKVNEVQGIDGDEANGKNIDGNKIALI